MKKTTSLKLKKRLAKYGALSVAIAGVAEANGQISYTDVDPDFAGGIGDEFLIDLNNDGTDDFSVRHNGASSLFLYPLASNNDFLGSGSASSNYVYPYALSNGAAISSGASGNWLNQGFSMGNASMNYGSSSVSSSSYTCSFGNWCDVTDRYLGLRFVVGGNTHYGWVRLDVNNVGSVWSVKDFAYNQTPDEIILAGQQVLGLDDNNLTDVKIVALNKTIALYNLSTNHNYKVLNMNGQEVLKGQTSNNNYVIDAQQLASGIYLIEVIGDDNTSFRKKIVL